MYWGSGPGLGLLTLLGYVAFTIGAALVWQNRDDVWVWVHDEFGAFRRSLSRYTVVGPFYISHVACTLRRFKIRKVLIRRAAEA